ncbi:MAG: LLM class F420-dependent oxidoreductase [Chloroflexaceae bacterium]|nr:LLM class F420-dependent oxidoreductase [Chloroflexaceae bacterium]
MKIGLQVPDFTWPGNPGSIGPTLRNIAQAADANGFVSLWVMDHFFQIEVVGPVEDPMLEGYTTLAYMAAVTSRIQLGTLVTGVIYRHPGALIKTVTTLDVLSGGRAYLGIGAGWFEREAVGLGLPFPPLKERFEWLEETLQIAETMWSGEIVPYPGKHYKLAEPMNHPPAITRPRPPIMIGGGGEKKTLRLVAQYGDACNLFAFLGPQELSRKLDILKQHCDDIGRDYNEIERTVIAPGDLGTGQIVSADLIQFCRGMADIGIQQVIFTRLPDIHTINPIEQIGREVIPAVADF